MKIKTSELGGAALDWAVAKCEGWEPGKYMMSSVIRKDAHGNVIGIMVPNNMEYAWFSPSTNWAQGGPIIDQMIEDGYIIQKGDFNTGVKVMRFKQGHLEYQFGPTPLISAMRCYAASKLGDEVEVPDEL